jgi:hypothetical protein
MRDRKTDVSEGDMYMFNNMCIYMFIIYTHIHATYIYVYIYVHMKLPASGILQTALMEILMVGCFKFM